MSVALTEQQSAVVDNRGGELLVSAAAGSGKTRVLVERLMDRVRRGSDIDRFLIITFTNAAAAELRARIAQAVSAEMALRPGDRHLRRNATLVWQAPISTIDAFCLNFLRECGPAAGLEPDFRLCDEAESAELRRQAMETVLERRYEGVEADPGFAALVDALAGDRDDEKLEDVVEDVYRRVQSHPDPRRWLLERGGDFDLPVDARPEDTPWGKLLLEDAGEQCAYWARELEQLREESSFDPALSANYGASLRATADHLYRLCDALRQGWDAGAALFPVPFPGAGRKKGADPQMKDRLTRLRDMCKTQMKQLGQRFAVSAAEAVEDLRAVGPAMRALLDVTAEYGEAFEELKRRRHLVDFSDCEHMTARMLVREDGGPTELAADWSRRYEEIMVDEYQDTNAVQNVIFNALSTGDNLFMVGDVKQSIYRFRLADPTIFLDKYGRYADYQVAEEGEGRTILLSRNFRSRPEVLEGVNFIFRNVMTKTVGEMDYTGDEALVPGRADLPPDGRYCMELDCVDLSDLPAGDEDEERPAKDLVEARAVAGRIAALLSGGLPIGGRPVTPEDIVILTRSPGPVLWAYTQALTEAGIPWQTEGSGEFFDTTEISVALSLLRVVDNPRQDVPLLSVLRSPLYAFSPDRLAELRAGGSGSVYDCLREGGERGEEDCARFLEELGQLRALAAEESSDQLIWHIYEHTGLLAVFSAMPDGERRRANLLALYDAARRFESVGHKGLFGFLTHIARMAENDLPIPVAGAGGGGVRILSIHKSKGLEFPVVFLCALERQFNMEDFKAPVLFHAELGLGPKRVWRERRLRSTTIAREAVSLRLQREMRSEELRLLYVGMTRAEHKLFLVTTINGRLDKLDGLAMQARCPPPPQVMAQARSMAPWVLLPALCRRESGALWESMDVERCSPVWDPGPAWEIRLMPGREYLRPLEARAPSFEADEEGEPDMEVEELSRRFRWRYPHGASVDMPSKLTATQLKGREKDEEAAEEGVQLRPQSVRRTLRRPFFERERPLTPAEQGTALHMAMQYLDYARTDSVEMVREEVERLVQGQYITPAQGAAVDPAVIHAFFDSELGRRLRGAVQVEREFKFSILVPAADYYPDGEEGEEVLLQGVVDCWFREADGSVTVVDFKTDLVTDESVRDRAEEYRPQLEAYTRALEEVVGVPVSCRSLWFFAVGREVCF